MAAKPPNLDTLLECPICLSECEDPRVLTCLHTLCRKCLDQHINTSAKGSDFLCPSCRHECEVPAGGVTSVPKNFFLNSLKAIMQQQGSQEKVSLPSPQLCQLPIGEQACSNSGRGKTPCGKAVVFCIECAQFYCPDCESSHVKFQEFRAHQLVPVPSADVSTIKAAVSRKSTPRCDQHSTLPNDMYCDTCRVPVCMKCCLLKHKRHEYREIEEAAEESRSLLSDLTKTAENIGNRLNRNLQELDVSKIAINKDCDEVCQQIHDNAEELRALVTEIEKSGIQEICQAKATFLTQLKAAYKEVELNKAAVESLLSYIQALLVSEDATSQVVHAPGLKEQLRQHEATPLRSVTLEVNLELETQRLSALKSMVGSVSAHESTVTHGSVGGTVPEEMKVSLDSPLLDLKPDIENNISGLVMMGDLICVTGYAKPYLFMHSTKTNSHKRHTLGDLCATGMTSVSDDTLVITDLNKKLHLVKTNQEMDVTEHVVRDVPFHPEDASLDPVNRKLIIANYTEKQIAICDTQGTVERSVEVKTSVGYLRRAIANSDGYIALDYSCFSSQLHWLNKDGDGIHEYGANLCQPCDAKLDSQGLVIIADQYNHRLHLVDANRNFSHYLLTEKDGIRYPRCVYLDEDNARLCVGYKDSKGFYKVSLYDWPFGTPSSLTHHKLSVKLNRYH